MTLPASFLRRLIAFAIDLIVIGFYALSLFLLVFLINGSLPTQEIPYNTGKQQIIGFVSLVLPVLIYFALCEWRFGQTLGKKIVRIRVVSLNGKNVHFGQAMVRNILKLLPWEIAHFGVHQFIAATISQTEIPTIAFVSSVFAQILVFIYAGFILWQKQRRTPYDLFAGTCVTSI